MRLVFPPVPAGIIMLVSYMTALHLLIPLAITRALFAGGLLGYIAYDMTHYYLHHGSPSHGSYLATLKSYHIGHHFINHNLGKTYVILQHCCDSYKIWEIYMHIFHILLLKTLMLFKIVNIEWY